MNLRRGFKTEAIALAREVRADLGLSLLDRLDPWELARQLEIPVWSLSDLDAESAVQHLVDSDSSAFSAVTVFHGTRRAIVHNDTHSPGRQASNVTHELAHGLLLHLPAVALSPGGLRAWDGAAEEEAQYLSGVLLITEEAALHIVRTAVPLDEAAVSYGVSRRMVQYRINVTGARKRVSRAGK